MNRRPANTPTEARAASWRRSSVAMLLALVTAGCASTGNGTDPGRNTPDRTATGSTGWITERLAELPDPHCPSPPEIEVGDFDTASSVAGLPRPAVQDSSKVGDWLVGMNRAGISFLPPRPFDDALGVSDAVRQQVGFDTGAVARYGAVSCQPLQIMVLTLRDGASLRADLPQAGGVRVLGTGSPGSLNTSGPLPFTLAADQREQVVALATRAELITAWQQRAPGVGADPKVAKLAQALDAKAPYAATILPRGLLTSERRSPAPGQAPRTARFDALAIGYGTADGARVAHVIYHVVGDAAAAEIELGRLWREGLSSATRRPYSELVSVSAVSRDGQLVTVTVAPKSPASNLLRSMLLRAEPVFISP